MGLKCSTDGKVKNYIENYKKTPEQKKPLSRGGRY
jgi:hypothetical protein